MDCRWSSEYHFLSKLYNKLLHRPTNDVVNFRGRGYVECACIRWERSRKRTHKRIVAKIKNPILDFEHTKRFDFFKSNDK